MSITANFEFGPRTKHASPHTVQGVRIGSFIRSLK